MLYPVNDLYSCIQGEGCQTGLAMVLLRLHGCGVGCPFCDTRETWEFGNETSWEDAIGTNNRYAMLSAETITALIETNHAGPKWILLTGGEPSDYDLAPLVASLQDAGYQVAIETSGTAEGHLNAHCDWVCVSPKIGMPGGKVVLGETIRTAEELKFVIGKQADIEKMDTLLAQHPPKESAQICLQPMSESQRATELCLTIVQERGWRLSIQTHKLLGVR